MDNIQFPPDSISLNTANIVKACEIAEISGTSAASPNSFILVTQLASLLYLRQYNHARHLWRRYRTQITSSDTEMQDSNAATATAATPPTASSTTNGGDMYQLQLLWNAAQPLLQSYYGHVSLLESGSNVFASLQSCVDANLHPLSLFALELKGAIRDQMAQLMETVYDTIPVTKCNALLGKSEDGDIDSYLVQRGWEKDTTTSTTTTTNNNDELWIPAVADSTNTNSHNASSSHPDPVKKGSQHKLTYVSDEKSKIDFLSNVVGFMEKQRVN